MIGTIDIQCNAAHPNMQLQSLYAFKNSPSNIRVIDVPKQIGLWNIENVYLRITYPDNMTLLKTAVKNGNIWVVTVQGTSIAGKVNGGYEILASGKDENGDVVDGYVLGCGDVIIIDTTTDIHRLVDKYTVRWLNELPQTPTTGDAFYSNGKIQIFNGQEWKYDIIPSKVSDLENDEDFVTYEEMQEYVGSQIGQVLNEEF